VVPFPALFPLYNFPLLAPVLTLFSMRQASELIDRMKAKKQETVSVAKAPVRVP